MLSTKNTKISDWIDVVYTYSLPAYAQISTKMEAHFPRDSGTTFKASKVASAASCFPIISKKETQQPS